MHLLAKRFIDAIMVKVPELYQAVDVKQSLKLLLMVGGNVRSL